MKNFTLLTILMLSLGSAIAQNAGHITGTVLQNGGAAEGATVTLMRAKDSLAVKLSVANKEGLYLFDDIKDGKYLVSATTLGHQRAYSKPFEITSAQKAIELPAMSMTASGKALNDVTVTAKRPLVEQRVDRTIVNVDASIMNIGTSALEVLEKSPGVSVDREGNISLKGKEGVLVMVDGRLTQLSGPDLANLLRNMTSSQLDQIEIMTNPPARYDAAGTAGIINIKTKKIITAGYNGSATLGVTQGRYPKTNEAINFNFRENKVNFFANLSHNYRKSFGALDFQRNIYDPASGNLSNYFDQESDVINKGNSLNGKIGLDFFATKKTTLGVVITGTSSPMSSVRTNTTRISNAAGNLQSITNSTVDNDTKWKSLSTNLNFRTIMGKKGAELTSDIDFIRYGSGTDQFLLNSYKDAGGNPFKKADTLVGDLPQDIQVYTARIDYSRPLKKGARLEAGVKTGMVRTDNDAVYDSVQNANLVRDLGRSNHFIYEENINAAYLNLSGPLSKKWSAQLGLRLENTNANGRQLTTHEDFNRHYTQLFPTGYVQYKANAKNNFSASVGRRVRRPSYASLNPFIRFIDKYTYTLGNPRLKPAVSNNIELTHSWRNMITTTLNYSLTTDIIEEVIEQRGEEAYKIPANLASQRQYGIAVSTNIPITKWWTSSVDLNTFYNKYKGLASGVPVVLSQTSVIATITQQFKLSSTLTGEINGRARNGWLEGVTRVRGLGFMGLGLSKQVMKGQGSLRLAVRDIFHSQRFRAINKYGDVDFRAQQTAETRVVSLAFSYRFSKGKKIAPVKRTIGSAGEEQERVGQ